ncbi:serine/threonine-protein kinase [Amycolatopsis pigmentata]|uniref:Serine/threonine-protein kinase n=1 Tax=Amycolatopsis pigmentata TaxID=450801 RepID=A0ABW5G6Y6_9PSEU
MGRRELAVDPTAGPVEAFAHALRRLRAQAGSPSYRALARKAGYSASALSSAASGVALPSLDVALAYAGACGGEPHEWETRWRQARDQAVTDQTGDPAPTARNRLSTDPPPAPGAVLRDNAGYAGPYRLRRVIGAGSMGRVHLAYTPGGRALAVKVIRADLAEDPEFRRRFAREVAAARRVHGMFTAEVLDADTDGPRPWCASAYVPGPSLEDAIAEHGPLPTESIWLLTAGVAEALQNIQSAGLVHRDLKPSNVLLALDGPRVIDFGIARASDASHLTRTGIQIGSPQFMAPEHVQGHDLTFAADVFALGGLVTFAATGHGPFGDGVDPAVLYRVVHEPPSLDRLSDDLRELVETCLHKQPGHRPGLDAIIRTCRERSTATSLKLSGQWLPATHLAGIHDRIAAIAGP